jgi:hypothetical protein
MSAIYFHTKNHGTHRVEGRERAAFGILSTSLANALAEVKRPIGAEPLYGYGRQGSFDEMLNSLLRLQSNTLTLLARIHGTCELWGWVADSNRDWLALLIEEALTAGLFRPDMGWEGLADLLKTDGVGEVVMSYSVTESFPSPTLSLAGVICWPGDEDEWAAMSDGEQWDYAHRWQVEQGAALDMDVEMRPENWHIWKF